MDDLTKLLKFKKMKIDICSVEATRLLKQRGFKMSWLVRFAYWIMGVKRPTQELAIQWIFDNYRIFIQSTILNSKNEKNGGNWSSSFRFAPNYDLSFIPDKANGPDNIVYKNFPTKRESLDQAIIYILNRSSKVMRQIH